MNGRYVAIISLVPWFILIFVKVLYAALFQPQLPPEMVNFIACAMWMVVSPAITALIILATYREGQWSKNDEIVDLQLENDALKLENAKLKSTQGVFQFD